MKKLRCDPIFLVIHLMLIPRIFDLRCYQSISQTAVVVYHDHDFFFFFTTNVCGNGPLLKPSG